MSDTNQNAGTNAVDAAKPGAAVVDATAARASGAAGTADAAGKQPDPNSAEYWKAEAKKAFEARDRALDAYKASPEYQAAQAAIAERDALKAKEAEAVAKAKADEEEAAKKRGEYQALYEKTVAERDAAAAAVKAKEAEIAKVTKDAEDRLNRRIAADALERTYVALGGFDTETFHALVGDPLAVVKIEGGKVEGAEAYVKGFVEKRPHLVKGTTDTKNGNGKKAVTDGKNIPRSTGLDFLRVKPRT